MSITSSTQHGADTQAKRAASANTRFARAFRAGEAALKGTPHSGDLLLYYKYLVARCGDGTNFIETQPNLADGFGTTVRSVQRYDDHLEALGLIWRRKVGRSYRRTITSYEPKPSDESGAPPTEVAAITDPHALLQAAADRHAAGDEAGAQALAWQAAMALAAHNAPAEAREEHADDKKISSAKDDRSVALNTTDRSGTPFKDSDSLIRQAASAACRTRGGGKDQHASSQPVRIPDTETARLLITHGFEDPATICALSAAPRDVIMDAYNRRMEVGGGPGLEAKVIREGRWKTCGKRVDKSSAMPALDDEDAWRERYIGGRLGRYIIGGPTDAPPDVDNAPLSEPERERRDAERASIDGWVPPPLCPLPALPDTPPDDDPELEKYRSNGGLPQWDDGGTA